MIWIKNFFFTQHLPFHLLQIQPVILNDHLRVHMIVHIVRQLYHFHRHFGEHVFQVDLLEPDHSLYSFREDPVSLWKLADRPAYFLVFCGLGLFFGEGEIFGLVGSWFGLLFGEFVVFFLELVFYSQNFWNNKKKYANLFVWLILHYNDFRKTKLLWSHSKGLIKNFT